MKVRSGLGLLALVALFLLAGVSDAHAIWHNDVNDPCPTYDDCTLSGPTETSQGGLTDPTPVTCYAVKSNSQGCRDCVTRYDAYGQPFGTICGYVQYDAGCKCEGQNNTCKVSGTCSYFAQ